MQHLFQQTQSKNNEMNEGNCYFTFIVIGCLRSLFGVADSYWFNNELKNEFSFLSCAAGVIVNICNIAWPFLLYAASRNNIGINQMMEVGLPC